MTILTFFVLIWRKEQFYIMSQRGKRHSPGDLTLGHLSSSAPRSSHPVGMGVREWGMGEIHEWVSPHDKIRMSSSEWDELLVSSCPLTT